MSRDPHAPARRPGLNGMLQRLRERGVVRVAASYAVIAWLLLQIADVTLEPLGAPPWAMIALISAAAVGLPIALAMAWFLEIGADGLQVDIAADGVRRPQARGLRHYVDAIVIGALVIVVAVLLVRQSDLGKPKPPATPAIAVLPFENLSGDPEQEYFSDGLAEEMLDRLGRVPGLKVIARSSSFGFKGSKLDAKTIAERLGVTTVLEGSVRRDGKRLRLTAQLIDGATGQQAWSGSFDRELTDIFAVQAELAGAVVEAIIPAARGTVVADSAPPTSDLNAYDRYLLARGQLAARTPQSIEKSIELMEDAVRLDPAFARAWAHLAASLLFQRGQAATEEDPERAKALERRAEAAIHRALALDPDLSEAHGAYATLLRDTEQPGAEERYKRALELNPNNATAWHDYAVYLGNVAGRPEESHRAAANSLELDPRQPITWINYLPRVVEPGGQRFRAEFRRAIRAVGDLPRAMDRLMRLGITLGYPVEVMEAGVAKRRMPVDGNLPVSITEARAWLLVDADRASRSLQGAAAPGSPMHRSYPEVLLVTTIELAGRREDWPDLDRALDRAQINFREDPGDDAVIRSIAAFWLSVQGRDEEAAQSLRLAEPLQESEGPAFLGHDMEHGMADLAQLRIYRATGRDADADRLAAERLAQLREMRRAAGAGCMLGNSPVGWTRYAGLAASEDLKDEAVQALRRAMSCSDLPFGFWPRLPWFRSLEGYAPYHELLRERERRVKRITKELEQLESQAARSLP